MDAPATALVVGGGSDLSTDLLCRLVPRGLRAVLLAGPRQPSLDAAARRLRDAGVVSVEVVVFDVRDLGDHKGLLERTVELHGGLGLVVIASGELSRVSFEEETGQGVAALFESTFVGPAAFVTDAARRMRLARSGLLVVFTSVAGVRVRLANLAYGAAKAGLDGFCQGVQDSLHNSGVRLMIVRPGFVHTKMTEGRRPAPMAVGPQSVVDAVIKGIERGRSVVWAPPSMRAVFALFQILPRPIWRRIDR